MNVISVLIFIIYTNNCLIMCCITKQPVNHIASYIGKRTNYPLRGLQIAELTIVEFDSDKAAISDYYFNKEIRLNVFMTGSMITETVAIILIMIS